MGVESGRVGEGWRVRTGGEGDGERSENGVGDGDRDKGREAEWRYANLDKRMAGFSFEDPEGFNEVVVGRWVREGGEG